MTKRLFMMEYDVIIKSNVLMDDNGKCRPME